MNLRGQVEAALPKGAFLRRDRGKALYVTDAPRLGWSREIPGFSVELDGGIARVTPNPEQMPECDFEPDAFALELARFRPLPPDDIALALFIEGNKILEAPEEHRLWEYDRRVRQAAAVALRDGGGGGLHACALLLAEIGRRIRG